MYRDKNMLPAPKKIDYLVSLDYYVRYDLVV